MFKALENISAHYANPTRFMRLAARLHKPLWAVALAVLAYGLWRALGVPDDYQQGATVKIMFVHVPAAWMALFGYSFIFFRQCDRADFQTSFGACCGARGGAGRGDFYRHCFAHRQSLGTTHVGHVVGLGCALDLGIGAVFHLFGLYRPVAGD